jgi:protocatechuate 3,4-dioxygenase beta subunit
MSHTIHLSRRILIGGGVGLIASSALAKAGALLDPTAEQALGPFYPVVRPLDQDADLTRLKSRKGIAQGKLIDVIGRVTDAAGRPVGHARIDLWQANTHGRYDHPGDTHDAPLDPNFQGSARITADASGHYRFRTILPGAYPIGGGRLRTRHIHADVMGRTQRLTTQMYFPDEPLNATDILLPSADPQQTVIARRVAPVANGVALAFAWDIVLAAG